MVFCSPVGALTLSRMVLQQAFSLARSSCALLFPSWRPGRVWLERAVATRVSPRLPGSAVTAGLRDRHHKLCSCHILAAWGRVASCVTGLTAPRETFPVPPNRIREEGCACGISGWKMHCQAGKGEENLSRNPRQVRQEIFFKCCHRTVAFLWKC